RPGRRPPPAGRRGGDRRRRRRRRRPLPGAARRRRGRGAGHPARAPVAGPAGRRGTAAPRAVGRGHPGGARRAAGGRPAGRAPAGGARPAGRVGALPARVGERAQPPAAQRRPPVHRRPPPVGGGHRRRRARRPGGPPRPAARRRAAARHRQGAAGRPHRGGRRDPRPPRPRMGFDERDSEVLVALVRLHLLLPEVATRRDIDDPATIAGVAEAVGSREVLELLAALTEADALATGPAAWTEWRAGLVRALVARVDHVLGGGDPRAVAEPFPTPAQRALLAAGRTSITTEEDRLT